MSDFAQYPHQALRAVGSSLGDIADQIGSSRRNAFEVMGLAHDQDRIRSALDRFRGEWEASVAKLGDNIGGLGETSTQIGDLSGQFDAELAASMSPGKSDGPLQDRNSARPQ